MTSNNENAEIAGSADQAGIAGGAEVTGQIRIALSRPALGEVDALATDTPLDAADRARVEAAWLAGRDGVAWALEALQMVTGELGRRGHAEIVAVNLAHGAQ